MGGEIGEDDLLPEIGVGRMSFSSQSELSAMLNKIYKYVGEPVLGELRDPLLAGEHLYNNPLTWDVIIWSCLSDIMTITDISPTEYQPTITL